MICYYSIINFLSSNEGSLFQMLSQCFSLFSYFLFLLFFILSVACVFCKRKDILVSSQKSTE